MKICFMGTPSFASKSLLALIENNYDVTCVYTRAPKPTGRGYKKVLTSSVYDLAQEKGIKIETPKSLRKNFSEQEKFLKQDFDLVIVASYGLILPKPIIDAPKYGCINIHASLLPRWRGASPIQSAIANGDIKTGITIMKMDEGLDTGEIIMQEETPITKDTTFNSLYNTLSNIGSSTIIKTLTLIKENKVTLRKQNDSLATIAPILTTKDGLLSFQQSASCVDQIVRAFNPFPSTYFYYKNECIKVLETSIIQDIDISSYAPGEVFSRGNKHELIIACKKDAIMIHKLQRHSKKPMLTKEFLNGFKFDVGSII